tara:strand:+ start:41 stop:349 length:309 start_codon:yes stop_codon:yes gene_type:complete
MKSVVLSLFLLGSLSANAKNLIRVKTLGKSPKGQFIAFEEFGFKNDAKVPFSKIRVMNVWKDKYVIKTIYVTDPKNEMKLHQIRAKAKKLANKQLKAFNIST